MALIAARKDLPPPDTICPTCTTQCLIECVQCTKCQACFHAKCTALPDYTLVQWFNGRVTYTCQSCVMSKLDNYDSLLAVVTNILERDSDHIVKYTGPATNATNQGLEFNDPDQTVDSLNSSNSCQTSSLPAQPQQQPLASQVSVTPQVCPAPPTNPASDCSIGNSGKNKTNSPSKPAEIKICRFYKSHSCKHGRAGKKCPYDHPKICYKYKTFGRDPRKGCTSKQCTNYHPIICRDSEKRRLCLSLECPFLHLKGTLRYQAQSFIPPPPTATATNRSLQQTERPQRTYPTATLTHTYHPSDQDRPFNQQHGDQGFLYQELQEMKGQISQLMKMISPMQWSRSPDHRPPAHLPNTAYPTPQPQYQY